MTRVQRYRNTMKGFLTNTYSKQRERNKQRGHGPLPYTLKEFHDYAKGLQNLEELFNKYIESGREKDLYPSFDRIDNSKGYSLDNIQLMTWAENNAKDRHTHRAIAVEQWSKDRTTFIASFASAREASDSTGVQRSKISNVCSGLRKSSGGYWWKKAEK